MKILTLNVHAWLEVDQMKKLQVLIDVLYEKDYDIIALQEVNQMMTDPVVNDQTYQAPEDDPLNIPIKKSNFARVIVEKLRERGLIYYWSWTASHVGYDIFDEGLAILSKTQFEPINIVLSDETRYDSVARRVALEAQTTINNQHFTIFSSHFSWWELEGTPYFKTEWSNLNGHLPEEGNVIVMGDFNSEAEVEGEGYDYIKTTSPRLRDSYVMAKEVTGEATMLGKIDGWHDAEQGKRIDYIFTSTDLKPKTHQVIFNGHNEKVVSDHFGIEVTF